VNFTDRILVQLADEQTRASVFDPTALEQIVNAAYDVSALGPLQGQLAPLFEELEIGVSVPAIGTLEGAWGPLGGVERTEARLRLTGMRTEQEVRVDALWRGAILARFARPADRIEEAGVHWPSKDIVDAAVAAAHGGTMPTGTALDQARRTELLAQVRATVPEPNAFTDDDVDALRKTTGASSIGNMLDRLQADRNGGFVQVAFADAQPVSPALKPLPLTTALLVRDAPVSIAELLFESKAIRDALAPLGLERPRDDALHQRRALVITWVVPAGVFTDLDWPGANAAARRAEAGVWLAREGIGLVVK